MTIKKLSKVERKSLNRAYFTPGSAGSFSSPTKLYKSLKGKISLSKIKFFLKDKDSYTLHRNIVRKFKRNAVISPFPDYQYDIDTANMTFYKKENKFNHILFVIDIFSRYLWTAALETLRGEEMVNVLGNILSERAPMKIRSDGGSEFVNKKVEKMLNDYNIDHIITKNETKANYAERVIRTIKDKMGKYMEHHQTNEWVDILPKITRSYNHTPHRSIGMRPVNVTKSNEVWLWNNLFGSVSSDKTSKAPPKIRSFQYKFRLGEHVRISRFREHFEKTSFSHRWSSEIFSIRDRYIKQGQALYELNDYMGDEVVGSFYQSELQSVTVDLNTEYKIEKIIRKRKNKQGILEYLVKFKGWPNKYNSWVKNLKKVTK